MGDAIDLTGDGGVLKTILRRPKDNAVGPTDDLPLVDVHYEGTLAETGEIFDSTREDNTIFSFEVGKGMVIKAWDIAFKTMRVGEIAKITCKPEYAYGSAGSPPDIPPDPTCLVTFTMKALCPTTISDELKGMQFFGSGYGMEADATLVFEAELVACRPRKGMSAGGAADERARLEELRKQREVAAAMKEEEKKKREEAKAAAAARIQAKLEAKKGQGKGKGKAK
ncbi:Peptidyl-prolyl cis-trans isomerase FKBP20-1 [Bienertia sinuspersici]